MPGLHWRGEPGQRFAALAFCDAPGCLTLVEVVEICQAFARLFWQSRQIERVELCGFHLRYAVHILEGLTLVDVTHRAVAQLVEQRSPKPQVAGSSPVRPAGPLVRSSARAGEK